jgi:hypothetical protein
MCFMMGSGAREAQGIVASGELRGQGKSTIHRKSQSREEWRCPLFGNESSFTAEFAEDAEDNSKRGESRGEETAGKDHDRLMFRSFFNPSSGFFSSASSASSAVKEWCFHSKRGGKQKRGEKLLIFSQPGLASREPRK